MKRLASAMLFVLMALVVGLWVLFVGLGCSSKGKGGGERVTAPHSVPQLLAALDRAEKRLGLEYRGETPIKVSYKTGTHRHKNGWWGEEKTIGGVTSILGGVNYRGQFITLYEDPKTKAIHDFPAEHEMMRAVLWSHGYRTEAEQNPIMRKAGWRW